MNASTLGLWGTGQVLREQSPATSQSLYRAIQSFGAPIIRLAMTRAMREVGCKLFPGETIKSALQATTSAKSNDLHSFDMLGKAACTQADAEHYFASYGRAIEAIGNTYQTNDPRQIQVYL